MTDKIISLESELEELFDIRYAKIRNEKDLKNEAMAAQKDVRLITHMFRDGVPDITIPLTDSSSLRWDSNNKRLILLNSTGTHNLEGAPLETLIMVRPHLALLVRQAKDFYRA
jgi:hypothetical protein